MSTGLECQFLQAPFPSEEKADDHLCANHANPGGFMIEPYDEATWTKADDALIKRAIRPNKKTRGFPLRRW